MKTTISKIIDLKTRLENLEKMSMKIGPRGGHIIGTSETTGEPIYFHYEDPGHKHLSLPGHKDAAEIHAKKAEENLGKDDSLVDHHLKQMNKHIEHYYMGGANDFESNYSN